LTARMAFTPCRGTPWDSDATTPVRELYLSIYGIAICGDGRLESSGQRFAKAPQATGKYRNNVPIYRINLIDNRSFVTVACPSMGAIEKIISLRRELRSNHKRIADFYISKNAQALLLTIREVAKATDTSVASVSRFFKKLGFQSYNQFRLELAYGSSNHENVGLPIFSDKDRYEDRIRTAFAEAKLNLELTKIAIKPENLKRVCDWIRKSDRVVFVGLGGAGAIGEWAKVTFSNIGVPCSFYSDPFQMVVAAGYMGKESILFALTHSGQSELIVRIMEIARARGSKVVLMTNYEKPETAGLADALLLTRCYERQQHIAQSSSSISMLCVMECLYLLVAQKLPSPVRSDLNHVEEQIELIIRPKSKKIKEGRDEASR
jgi:RpiR family carbohydrate utilization transcriptional regulator